MKYWRRKIAGNDVEPYFSAKWGRAGVSAGAAFEAAKAACIQSWRQRVAALEALTFEDYRASHLHPDFTKDTLPAESA